MSWWKELLKQIATNFGLAVADAGTAKVTEKIAPKARDTGRNLKILK
jgi:hypothetical protein